jgi:hypothetical protein
MTVRRADKRPRKAFGPESNKKLEWGIQNTLKLMTGKHITLGQPAS